MHAGRFPFSPGVFRNLTCRPGVMMNKQANILQRFIEVGQSEQLPPPPPPLALPPLESYSSMFPDQEVPCDIFPETDQLLQATPFYNSIGQGRPEITEQEVDALLRNTLEEMEEKQQVFSHLLLPNLKHKQEIKTEPDTEYFSSGLGQAPTIMGPEMCWTKEETNILDRLLTEQTTASKTCCPVR